MSFLGNTATRYVIEQAILTFSTAFEKTDILVDFIVTILKKVPYELLKIFFLE